MQQNYQDIQQEEKNKELETKTITNLLQFLDNIERYANQSFLGIFIRLHEDLTKIVSKSENDWCRRQNIRREENLQKL